MYLMYVDESGDSGKINSPTRYFILSALVIHELRWNSHLQELIEFRRELKRTKGLKLSEEIHSTHFVNSPGVLKRIPRNDRLDIMKKCLDWVAMHQDLSVITVVVDKNNQTSDIFEIAWSRLIQRFENTIRYGNFPGPKNADERGLILPDNTEGEKLKSLLRKMRHYNTIPNNRSIYDDSGYRNIKISYIIEDPFMKDSSTSFFHQLVDVIAYSARQLYEPNRYIQKKGAVTFYQRLGPVLFKKASLKHPLGIVEA